MPDQKEVEFCYYNLALLRSAAPILTYRFAQPLEVGQQVRVPVKGTVKEAVVIAEVAKPEFATEEIAEILPFRYRPWQMEAAKFIAEYYFSSFGEALSLFLPFDENGSKPEDQILSQNTDFSVELPVLSDKQRKAYEELRGKETALLFGVTGSGKTELYIHRMAEMLRVGKSTILLMPEIALTPQMEKRLKRYFGERVALWHSRLTRKKREGILEGIRSGEIRIVAGARSALFVPLENLGLIIVDEEHDDSYKAMTRPRYHARDLALYLGKKLGAQVWLASATPSVGSYVKYPVARLKEPYVKTRKRYRFIPGDSITLPILKALEENYRKKEQSLVFVPTRANFKYLWCENCGKTHECPYCSVGMSLHRRYRHLRCHHCNYTEPIRERCAHCGHLPLKSDRLGTEEAIEIIERAIPGIRIEQFDKDAITTPGKLERALKRIESGESDVIVGTQMLSKGHDYPNITLSVITGLDYLAGMGDYRAKERAVALLHQIAGRSGRSKDAQILIQSAQPEFFAPWLEDYEPFLKEEAEFRRMAEYPPFAHLARILIAHKEEAKAAALTEETAAKLQAFPGIGIVGYGPAPIERIAGKYRYTILLRAQKRKPLLQALHAVAGRGIEIDMDPVEFS
ncbi:primosomal protein N' [Nitratifractor salsuginis]|uniref:Replication restart protein PriA n=1 Tax=Nitratifractor salsuginis (strain DSM 16511 / JCM 12458 / E9I37-1) TaxID=749222 RepID=E6X2Y7_NITSE|nr:primosomal protein N' [Nitratifractor salsuginis]ADV47270.1 primosomal protein N' [Nitratifractor salsuginis DSM 16511]